MTYNQGEMQASPLITHYSLLVTHFTDPTMTPIPAFADLEIRLFARTAQGYPIELTLDSHLRYGPGHLSPDFLPWTPRGDPVEDGAALFAWLMGDSSVVAAWTEARSRQPQRRIRLVIAKDAPELHALPWELLVETRADHVPVALAAAAATPFSRYFAGAWQPGRPVLARPIRVLAAIASPSDLADLGLPAFDIDHEWQILADATGDLDVETIRLPQPCTLAALETALRDGVHILHVVAHGGFDPDSGQAFLALCDDAGKASLVTDQQMAGMLARILQDTQTDAERRLRMVFLDSCETASRDSADAFRGFAPTLVQAGVPAVMAMQEAIAVETSQLFTATFYQRLLAHGLVDLACNEARATLLTRNLPGAAIPVLFMRLPGGLLFGRRGQILGQQADIFWETLLENIRFEECVPFLGPGVTARLLPSPQDLAVSLAQKYGYPFPDGTDLPRVAQFVATTDSTRLRRDFNRLLAEGFLGKLGLDPAGAGRRAELADIVAASDWIQRSRGLAETEIHQDLADLGLPLYLTTNYDPFMAQALADRGRAVRQEIVPWQEAVRAQAGRPQRLLDPEPSSEQPVVVHLFGATTDPMSMVLTEDDHLDFLARIARDHEYMLTADVSQALAKSTLLFLGFRLQDLEMKVILRGLLKNLALETWDRLNVAVQLDEAQVDEDRVQQVVNYFQKYFAKSKIDVFWGSVEQFVTELHDRWLADQGGGGHG